MSCLCFCILFEPFEATLQSPFIEIAQKTATKVILQNFVCCVPQKNKQKSYRFGLTWVSRWYQTFHFLFLIKSALFINRKKLSVFCNSDQGMTTSITTRLHYISFPPADLSADFAKITTLHSILGSHSNRMSPLH